MKFYVDSILTMYDKKNNLKDDLKNDLEFEVHTNMDNFLTSLLEINNDYYYPENIIALKNESIYNGLTQQYSFYNSDYYLSYFLDPTRIMIEMSDLKDYYEKIVRGIIIKVPFVSGIGSKISDRYGNKSVISSVNERSGNPLHAMYANWIYGIQDPLIMNNRFYHKFTKKGGLIVFVYFNKDEYEFFKLTRFLKDKDSDKIDII